MEKLPTEKLSEQDIRDAFQMMREVKIGPFEIAPHIGDADDGGYRYEGDPRDDDVSAADVIFVPQLVRDASSARKLPSNVVSIDEWRVRRELPEQEELDDEPSLYLVDPERVAVDGLAGNMHDRMQQEVDRVRNEIELALISNLLEMLETGQDTLDRTVIRCLGEEAAKGHLMLEMCGKAVVLSSLAEKGDATRLSALTHVQLMARCVAIVAANMDASRDRRALNKVYINRTSRILPETKGALASLLGLPDLSIVPSN